MFLYTYYLRYTYVYVFQIIFSVKLKYYFTLHLTEVVEIEAVSNNQVTDSVPKI